MKAYSYLRFSSAEQMKGDSFRRQTEASEKYAAEHGFVLDEELKMQDLGVSAFDKSNITKGALGVFLRAVEKGQVEVGSVLIVESLDRLSRAQTTDALQQFIAILSAGIGIITLCDNQHYSKSSIDANPMQLMGSLMYMVRAHEESETKSKRVSAAWQKKLRDAIEHKKVITKNVPLWMQVVEGKIELIPERAEVVRRVFKMMKDGNGEGSIVKAMNQEVAPWSREQVWHGGYITKIATNPATYGALLVNDVLVDDYFPAVITRDEFHYIQHLRSSRQFKQCTGNRKGEKLTNLFSGLTYCGYCGYKTFIASAVSKKTKIRHNFLLCYGARIGATKCACVRWDYGEIEHMFLMRVSQLDLATLFGTKDSGRIAELEKSLMAISGKIEELKKKVENLYVAIEEDPLPGLTRRIKILEVEIQTSERQKDKITQSITSERYVSTSGNERRKALMDLFRFQAKCADDAQLRIIREKLFHQIHSIVKKIELLPTGPVLKIEEKELRKMIVYFKSGAVTEIAAC